MFGPAGCSASRPDSSRSICTKTCPGKASVRWVERKRIPSRSTFSVAALEKAMGFADAQPILRTTGLRCGDREARLVIDLERHRAGDGAFLGRGVMQAAGQLFVRTGGKPRMRPQRHGLELPGAVGLFDHEAQRVVAVIVDHDAGVRAKMQVPKLMARCERGEEKLFRIPAGRVTP